ncbi:hypothetical protein B0H19DRAFT_1124411 [Mycena capillaripes]|nr:hypothetical protein B0H19DRAFT_1124411 [Mycena capillaripes]
MSVEVRVIRVAEPRRGVEGVRVRVLEDMAVGGRRVGCSAPHCMNVPRSTPLLRREKAPITRIWNRDPATKRSVHRSRGTRHVPCAGKAALRIGAVGVQARKGAYVTVGYVRGPHAGDATGVKMPVLRGEAANAARAMANGGARWRCLEETSNGARRSVGGENTVGTLGAQEVATPGTGNNRTARGEATDVARTMGKRLWSVLRKVLPVVLLRDLRGAATVAVESRRRWSRCAGTRRKRRVRRRTPVSPATVRLVGGSQG